MSHKMRGIIPIIVAMLFIAFFATGDNEAVASDSNSATQTVTVNVQGSAHGNNHSNNTDNNIPDNGNIRGDIALNVIPTTSSMTRESSTNTNYFIAYSGSGPTDENINVKNTGTVPINVFIRSASTQFTAGANSFIPTIFTINSQDSSPINILTANSNIATNMPVNGIGSNFSTHVTLGIPLNTPAANGYQNQLTYTTIEYT